MTFHVPERYRVITGPFRSSAADGNNGAFFVRNFGKAAPGGGATRTAPLKVIVSDGEGWEHVSVSLPHRCPTWDEMCSIVATFWDEDDCVMQLHPPRKDWISNHPFCLHLWRPTGAAIPMPPSYLVGYKELGDIVNGSDAVKAEARRRYDAETLLGDNGETEQ